MSELSAAGRGESGAVERVRRRWVRRLLAVLVTHAVVTLVAVFVAFVVGWAVASRGMPDLEPWHEVGPAGEFVAGDAVEGYALADYLRQEDLVFADLDRLVDEEWVGEEAEGGQLVRYRTGSRTDPRVVLDRNWNRSFVLEPEGEPVGGALLVHGLSDSPYSLRTMGLELREAGWYVVGLRVPGHGTTPKALEQARIGDWTAAVRIAAAGVRARVGEGRPTMLVGFSNGGALVVNDVLAEIESGRVTTDGIVLISPMIGVSPFAQLTRTSHLLSWAKPFEKFKWLRIEPEIDPFKYASFSQAQSERAWLLTRRVEGRISRLARQGRLGAMPPVLAFQSVVDATVSTPALIDRLMSRLPADGGHALVLFDVNQRLVQADLLRPGVGALCQSLLAGPVLPFDLCVVTNGVGGAGMTRWHRPSGATEAEAEPMAGAWPEDVFSLSHGCLVIPPEDPVLGTAEATRVTGLPLGTLSVRGETGVLAISPSWLIRQRYNPFFDEVRGMVGAFQGRLRGMGEGSAGEPPPF